MTDNEKLLQRLTRLENTGYICRPNFDGIILNSASTNEILFHFKKKEELVKSIQREKDNED